MKQAKQMFENRIMVLDGAMGTMIQRYLPGTENPELLNLEHPEVIETIHREYIDAGADIIESNTFSANRISQNLHGLATQARKMAYEGARIARKAADSSGRKILVAGSVGPTSKSLTLAQDADDPSKREYSFDEMVNAYEEQIAALIEGGVDFLQIETCFDALNCKAALYAAWKVGDDIPVSVSVSASDRSGRTLTGQTLKAFYTSVRHYPLIAFGINCSLGADEMFPLVEEISDFSDLPLVCYPNAGLPNEMGLYDESPDETAENIAKMARKGLLNIVGGCCGTTPEHIRAIAEAVKTIAPRKVVDKSDLKTVVSGLEVVNIDLGNNNFTNVGERTNVAGSRKFARLIASGDYDQALQIASDQIENGASIIDINMDDAMLDSTVQMQNFVRRIQNDPCVARAALMIDSSRWDTVLAGLKNAQGRCIVNSISLKEGQDAFLEKAREISRLGAAMVVMAFDENGQATTLDRKIEICERSFKLLTENGIAPQDIIFDCNVLSVGTGIADHAKYGVDFIEAVRWIKSNLPGSKTSGGISNLSFAFRGNNIIRQAMHSVFLYHAIKAGLDMGIVNPGMLDIYDEIEPGLLRAVEDVILDKDSGATDRLTQMAQQILNDSTEESKDMEHGVVLNEKTVDERLMSALIKGDSSHISADALESMELHGNAVDVIEGPLMEGMKTVGELFGNGKMFLPQVVKSAKVMRTAISALEPYMSMDEEKGSRTSKPRIVLATVKGDIHDIGKNITGIVLNCNGFEVTDLGVMVERERILDTAQEEKADIVAVSGLITPSLYQMEEICRGMSARGMTTPLFVGGATTSALHTAVKLAPLYNHVFYSSDASVCAVNAKRYMTDKQEFEDSEHAVQARLRELYDSSRKKAESSVVSSRKDFIPEDYLRVEDASFEDIPPREIPFGEILPFFDWRMYLHVWGIKDRDSSQAAQAIEEGKKVMEELAPNLSVRIAARFFAAYSNGEGICFESPKNHLITLPMLRQEEGEYLSLCDYLPKESLGFKSPFGVFSISVHQKGHGGSCSCAHCQDEYLSMTSRAIRVCMAEAASIWLDEQLAGKIHRKGIRLCKPAAGYASCPDHSLKRDIMELLPDSKALDIKFTESYAMIPDASICGFIFAHTHAKYPEIRHISTMNYEKYSQQRGFSHEEALRFLSNLR